jgi:hypothetical protein
MALFNLTDIAYKAVEARDKFVPLVSKVSGNAERNRYYQNMRRYPIDLGSVDRGHYMLIHINVQDKSSYKADFSKDIPTIQRNRTGLQNQTGATNIGGFGNLGVDNLQKAGGFIGENTPDSVIQGIERVKEGFASFVADKITPAARSNIGDARLDRANDVFVNIIKFGSGVRKGLEDQVGNLNNANFLRTTKRTTETIALYMPGTMAYTHNQQYNQLQMGGENAALFGAGMSLITDAVNGKVSPEQLGKNLTPFIAEKIKNISSPFLGTNSATGLFASMIGGVQNPQLELIYTSPSFRSFRFDFMFYPSSEVEAVEVQKIIESLKFHQAPEIMRDTAGYFLVPPSEFDIEFHYNGEVNPNIPKISTCVLTSIDMDYAPKGFVAFEVPGQNTATVGGTGMPFAIRLSLSFQETEIMTKYNFQDGRQLK